MCDKCNCGCSSTMPGIYGTNMWNVNSVTCDSNCNHQQACNGCVDVFKTTCIVYPDVNLVNTGINKNDDLTVIVKKLDTIKGLQDKKNQKILDALNDINTRLNALEGGSHAAYTL